VAETSTPSPTRPNGASSGGTDAPEVVYPLVTVALVAHNPGAWFEEALGSLVQQDYPALEIVVIDAASEELVAGRVHDVIPEATVVPLLANQGFAKNANTILDQPGLGQYLLICHDDVALAPDCIRRLVEETLRSNAGVVGPKLLDWDDPNRILHVGLGADKTGLVSELAEPGEYDQEQHDAVRDVFAVPGAVTLIRTDLFQTLEGFDEAMLVQGEDLDFCWRAHALGARVIVNPTATARHREDLNSRIVGHDEERFTRRHRIRSMMSNYSGGHLLVVLPQAFVASLVNVIFALWQGRLGVIANIASAWWWNLRRLPSIRRRRRQLAQIRQVPDAEVRAMQVRGFEGWHAWRRRRADRQASLDLADADTDVIKAAGERRRWFQATLFVWIGVALVLLFGSRSLIRDGLPVFNQFVSFPNGPTPLAGEWTTTWRSTGVGAEAPSSLLHVILGSGGIALFGQMGFLRLLVTVGMLGVGVAGAYRLLSPFQSIPAQLVALVVYASVPLPYNALHDGSWSGLVAYGAMPWIAKRLAIAAGIPPFGDEEPSIMRRLADIAMVAFITAAAALVDPLIGGALGVLAVGWILGGLVTRRVDGLGRLIVATVLAAGLGFALLMPASLGAVMGNADWTLIGGTRAIAPGEFRLDQMLRLATGPHGANWVGWALLVLPALSLLLAFGHRLAWAARCWIVTLGSVGIAWWAEHAATSIALSDPHVLLAPAGMSLAFAAGMTAMAFERDLRRYRFGWRQAVPFVAAMAVCASMGAGLGGSLNGRWLVAEDGYDTTFATLDAPAPAHGRTLWIGESDILPVNGWRYSDDLTFALTHARTPSILDYTPGNADEQTLQVRDIVKATLDSSSSRLGQQLSFFDIRYIVVVEGNAPAPFLTDRALVRVPVRPGVTIYENKANVPLVSSFPAGTLAATDPASPPPGFGLALPVVTSMRTYRGPVQPGELYVGTPASTNWSLDVDGQDQTRLRLFGWAQLFTIDSPGEATLVHSNETSYWLGSIAQLSTWIIGLIALLVGRRRRL